MSYLFGKEFKLFKRVNMRAFHKNPNSLYTELTFINP